MYPFLTKHYNWQQCVRCEGDVNYSIVHGILGMSENEWLCFGDAYRLDEDEMGWFQKMVCNPDSRCMPPLHFYYEYDTGTFDCIDLEYCSQNNSNYTTTAVIDEELKSAGAELRYKGETDKSYKKAILFKCSKDLKPQITLFGIPIFDYKIWLFLMIIGGMFIFLNKIKKH